MKVCGGCRVEQPLSEFSVRSASPDGLQNSCKTCFRTRYRGMPGQPRPVLKEQLQEEIARLDAENRRLRHRVSELEIARRGMLRRG